MSRWVRDAGWLHKLLWPAFLFWAFQPPLTSGCVPVARMPLLSCPRMQTINCLELWAKLLAAKADEPELRPLIYPVTQLLLGAARLVPAPAYFPLRLRCARALNRLGEATGTFIPVAPILLEVLQWSDLRRSPKPGPGQQPDVLLQLRVTKASMRSAQYRACGSRPMTARRARRQQPAPTSQPASQRASTPHCAGWLAAAQHHPWSAWSAPAAAAAAAFAG